LLHCKQRPAPPRRSVMAGGHHPGGGGRRLRAPERKDPQLRPACTDLVRSCAASQSWSSACASAWKRAAGWRSGPPCGSPGCAQQLAAGRLTTAASGLQELPAALWSPRAARTSHLRAQRRPSWRESGAAVPSSARSGDMTPRLLAARCSSNPGGDRPGQSPARGKATRSGRRATGWLAETQGLVARAAGAAGALSGGPWSS